MISILLPGRISRFPHETDVLHISTRAYNMRIFKASDRVDEKLGLPDLPNNNCHYGCHKMHHH